MEQNREDLIKEYEQFVMIEDKNAEDVLIGKRKEDLEFEIESVDIMYNKQRICAKLFELLTPSIKEVVELTQEMYDFAVENHLDLEEVESLKDKSDCAKEVYRRAEKMVYYDSDDLHNIDLTMQRIDKLNMEENYDKLVDEVSSARILINLSKIATFEEYDNFYKQINQTILRLKDKRAKMLGVELSEE